MDDVKSASIGYYSDTYFIEYYHTFVLKNDGTLWAFGYNGKGQLGNGSTENTSQPFQLMSDVAQVKSSINIPGVSSTTPATGDNSYLFIVPILMLFAFVLILNRKRRLTK